VSRKFLDDDRMYKLNTLWRGPEGMTFPFYARYIAFGIFLAVLFVEFRVVVAAGVHQSFSTFAYMIIGAVFATRWVGRRVTHEVPFGAWLTSWWQEISTPRRVRKPQTLRIVPAKVTIRGDRRRRFWQRKGSNVDV